MSSALKLVPFLTLVAPSFSGDLENYSALIAFEVALSTMQAEEVKTCPTCNGKGKVKAGDGRTIVERVCDSCNGTGKVPLDFSEPAQTLPAEPEPVTEPVNEPEPTTEPVNEPELLEELLPEVPEEVPEEVKKRIIYCFTADWCVQCKRMESVYPQIEKLGFQDYEAIFVDFDSQKDLVARYGITHLPAYVVTHNGREIARHVGYMTPQAFVNLWNKNRKSARELREFARGYNGPPYYVRGMSTKQHLITPASEHAGIYFLEWQLQGLTESELQKIHGAVHENKLIPFNYAR